MNFVRVLAVLDEAGVEYIVIGGFAAVLHGSARSTLDINLLYRRTAENLTRLASAIAPFHPYMRGAPPGLPFSFDVRTLQQGLNFTLTTDLGPIDLLGHVPGMSGWDDLEAGSQTVEVAGRSVRLVDLDTLIALKRAAGRPKDLYAIAELVALRELQS